MFQRIENNSRGTEEESGYRKLHHLWLVLFSLKIWLLVKELIKLLINKELIINQTINKELLIA